MVKYFFISLIVTIQAMSMGSRKPQAPIPLPTKPTTHIAGTPINVDVVSLTGFNPLQALRFRNIAARTASTVNSPEYKSSIVTHMWNGSAKLTDTNDTPAQVYEKITSDDWHLEYRLESIRKSTVGYTYPTVSWIVINSKLFDSMADADIAANIAHEYGGHKFGRYSHASSWSAARDHSAPYWIGTSMRKSYK